jgi:hypothetical protein
MSTDIGSRREVRRNGAALSQPPLFSDLDAARVVVRVARDRQAPPLDEFRRLGPEWAEAAGQAQESGDKGLANWLRHVAIRYRSDPLKAKAFREALEAAQAEGPGDSQATASEHQPFDLKLIDTETFLAETYRLEWLIKGILLAFESCVLGGPQKSLKTSILIDLVISGGTGTPYLGRFEVPHPIRAGLISGESGRAVIQANVREVLRGRAFPAERLRNMHWGFTLPQLTNAEHLAVMRKTIEDRGLQLLGLDPLYLALLAGSSNIDPRDMFQMGPLLVDVAQTCLGCGCTPILAHHFTKRREDPFGPPEMDELAYAGVGQFMRQWQLLSRRERFDAEAGIHRLHFRYGGTAGHCGELLLDIETGRLADDFTGRKWLVTTASPLDGREAEQQQRQAQQAAREAEKARAAEARQAKQLQADAERVYAAMVGFGRPETLSNIAARAKLNHAKTKTAVFALVDAGRARAATAKVRNRNGTREIDGYEAINPVDGSKPAQETFLGSNPD